MDLFKRAFAYGRRALKALTAHRYTTVAGALAFFLVMSFVPFLFWLALLFGQTGLETETVLELGIFGWAKDLLIMLLSNAEGAAAGAGAVLLLTTLWSSSAFFYHLRKSGEILYAYRREKHGWKVRLSAILVTFAVLLFCLAAGAALITAMISARKLPRPFFYLTVYSLVLTIGFLAAWILNCYICPYRCKPHDTLLGSFFTALAWLVATGVFSVCIRFGNREKLYGALTLAVVFLIWIYWMMICFTAGAVYNRRRMKIRGLEPKEL